MTGVPRWHRTRPSSSTRPSNTSATSFLDQLAAECGPVERALHVVHSVVGVRNARTGAEGRLNGRQDPPDRFQEPIRSSRGSNISTGSTHCSTNTSKPEPGGCGCPTDPALGSHSATNPRPGPQAPPNSAPDPDHHTSENAPLRRTQSSRLAASRSGPARRPSNLEAREGP